MRIDGGGIAIRRLYEMLEGQVAVLSSGVLSAREAAALLDALRSSRLYRADQNSYVLYPDRKLPGFFEKNNIPAAAIAASTQLTAMIDCDDRRIVIRDSNGVAHFKRRLPERRAVARRACKAEPARPGMRKDPRPV